MADGTLIFDTKIDDTGFRKDLDSLSKTGKKAVANVQNIVSGILGAEAIMRGGQILLDFGKKAITLASDLEEVQNVVDVTFGESAEYVNDFAESASEAFGLTELQAKQYTGTFGAMIKSMGMAEDEAADMAISMAGLVGDMASFYNLDHETAFEKIRSGLAGETEPLRQLGINMSVANLEAYRLSKGIETAYDSMTEAERVQLRYNFIMDQTADSQGDFARTQDSFANQLRMLSNNMDTLASKIGNALLPVATNVISGINTLLSGSGYEEPPVVTEINETIDSLDNLDTRVTEINNNFMRETIKINVDYTEAQALIDKIDKLQKEQDENGLIDLGTLNLSLGDSGDNVALLQEALSSLGYIITDEEGVFGESTKTAVQNFQNEVGIAVDGIVGKNTAAWLASRTTAKAMEGSVQALVDLYPELAKYVGEDGTLSIELEEVEALIDGYRRLAIEKAVASRIEAITEEYYNAYIDLEMLKQNKLQAEEELQDAQKLAEDLELVSETIRNTNQLLQHSPTGTGFYGSVKGISWDVLKDKETLEATVETVQAYIDAIGGLDTETAEALSAGGVDLTRIFSDGSTLLSAEEIRNSEEALQALFEVYKNLVGGESGIDEQNDLGGVIAETIIGTEKDISALEGAVDDASAAIEEFQPEIDALKGEMDTLIASKQQIIDDLSEAGTESGEQAGDKMAESLSGEKGTITSVIKSIIGAAQRSANANPIRIPVRYKYPSSSPKLSGYGHATGLYRVPYDNYYARLHAGERVLTAAEAREYNRAESASAGLPQEPIIIEQPAQTIVVDIGGYRFAEAQVESNRIALNNLSKKIAQGRGHR